MSGFLSIFDLFFKVTIAGTPQQHPASNTLMERVGNSPDNGRVQSLSLQLQSAPIAAPQVPYPVDQSNPRAHQNQFQ